MSQEREFRVTNLDMGIDLVIHSCSMAAAAEYAVLGEDIEDAPFLVFVEDVRSLDRKSYIVRGEVNWTARETIEAHQ